ncbi:hypothetical protein [Streptomyces sp. 7N604]|uniref:hypothetical protein n=1 Tax=Streptomyces sp. 7N604 TaxID=3457415 RepID=UPI003FD227AB
MDQHTAAFTEQFESKFGYPPDVNAVEPVSESESAVEAGAEGIPEDLAIFYGRVSRVSLPDLESGFFVHPLDLTLRGLRGDFPTQIVGSREDSVVVFGSDGGGGLFALSSTDGSTVYRLPPSRVEGSVYVEGGVPCEVVGSNLEDFLSMLERLVSSQVA